MFNNIQNKTTILSLPDRLLTEKYKDERQREFNRFEMLKEYTHDAPIEEIEKILYKHNGDSDDSYIFSGRFFKRKDIEDYIEWRKKEWL